jgi:hypothetical protein
MKLAHLFVLALIISNFSMHAAWIVPERDEKITRQNCEQRYTLQVNCALACVFYAYRELLPGKKFELQPGQFEKDVRYGWTADDSFVSWFEDEITGYLGFVYGETNRSPMKAIPSLHPRDYWTLGWKPEAHEVRQLVTAPRKSDMDQKVACAQEALQPHLPSVLRPFVTASIDQGISVQDLIDLGWSQQPRSDKANTLQLCGFGLTSLRGLQASEAEMKTIKCIDLCHNNLESIVGEDEKVLTQFKSLERLYLESNKLKAIGKLFETIPSLQEVFVDKNPILIKLASEQGYHFPLRFGGERRYQSLGICWKRDQNPQLTAAIRREMLAEQDQKSRANSVEEDSMGDGDHCIPIYPLPPLPGQRGNSGAKAEEHE